MSWPQRGSCTPPPPLIPTVTLCDCTTCMFNTRVLVAPQTGCPVLMRNTTVLSVPPRRRAHLASRGSVRRAGPPHAYDVTIVTDHVVLHAAIPVSICFDPLGVTPPGREGRGAIRAPDAEVVGQGHHTELSAVCDYSTDGLGCYRDPNAFTARTMVLT